MKSRIVDFGEVFTKKEDIINMFNMQIDDILNIDEKIIEPTCGDGNYLVEIYRYRLNEIKDKPEQLMHMLNNIYAVDIQEDNINIAKKRSFNVISDFLDKENITYNKNEILDILNKNIICADFLNDKPFIDIDIKHYITNPPYQLTDGGYGRSAQNFFVFFFMEAINRKATTVNMFIPSRWFAAGKNTDDFRLYMSNSKHLKHIVDFKNSKEKFDKVDIKGGVSYVLWDKRYNSDKTYFTDDNLTSHRELDIDNFIIRDNHLYNIAKKVYDKKKESFSKIVSPRNPYGMNTKFDDFDKEGIDVYKRGGIGKIDKKRITKNAHLIDKYKIYIPAAIGSGNLKKDKVNTIVGLPNTACTETYLSIGPFDSLEEVKSAKAYIDSSFFRAMWSIKKITQHNSRKTFDFIPLIDFTKDFTINNIYKEFNITDDERAYLDKNYKK